MPDISKLHFANFFKVFTDTNQMQNNELAFDSTYRLIFKDNTGVLHPIVSVADYANIYSPLSITVTQTVKTAKVGVGTEGDFSNKVTRSMPLSNTVTATGIHRRLMLVQYDSADNLKDAILFPEFFCKIGSYADVLDLNKGVMTEHFKKVEIEQHQGKTTLSNNNVFRIYLTETSDVITTLNYPMTVEANNNNIANRNQMYIGNDGYLYIITANTVNDLPYPFWFINRRTQSVKVRVNTTIPLIDKDDKFVFESYRYVSDNIVGTSYQFIGAGETSEITKVLIANKTTSIGKEQVNLGISGDKKSVTGIESGAHYTITVITNEMPVIPSLVYSFLDVQEGFFGYLYTILKNINDNEQQAPIDLDSLAETVRLSLLGYLDEQLALKADLASPALTGTPTAPTAAVNTNTTQIATTAYVLGQAGTATPLMAGTAAVGTATRFAREDHRHPIDTSRAPLASPALTGTPTAPTAAVNTNTTQIATTAFVLGQAGTATPLMAGTSAVGTATRFAREDHRHPIDTTRAPVDSPTFTTLVRTPDIDVQGNAIWNVNNIPIINIIPDSGRFMGNQQDPYALISTAPFTLNNDFFTPANGGNTSTGGKFINNNTDNGGNAGTMTADAVALVNAMNTIAGKHKRYGPEFHILEVTQGSGTNTAHTINTSHYLLTINNSKSITGASDHFTFSYWVRLKTGTGATIHKVTRLLKNGVDVAGTHLNLSTSDGWMHIQGIYKSSSGYDNAAPNIYAPSGAVVQIAIPVITPGGTGTGIHTSPIPRVDFGYTAASTNNPTFTGNVVLPSTTTIGTVTGTEIGYLSGVTSSIQTQITARAPLASPALTGTPTAPTAAVNTNTTQIATTAFVLGQVGTATPSMNGTAAVGTATRFAREDHVHPTDTSRAPLASPTLTGTPTAPTAAVNTNTTQIATTAYVLGQAGTATPLMAGTAAVGTATRFAREDHVHPTDTSRAPLASPAFTGTVSAQNLTIKNSFDSGYFFKSIGRFSTLASTANQKIDLYYTGSFYGYLQVTISGSWLGANVIGNITKTFAIAHQPSSTINHQVTKYTEVFGGIASNFAISDVTWDSTNNRWRIQIVYLNSSNTGIENITVSISGHSSIASTITNIFSAQLGSIYTTDTTVFSPPQLYNNIDLSGTPTAPTAAVNTNTTQLATTAFVLGQAATATPLMAGTAAVGTATRFAREDHVHPTDTSRAPTASPALTGTPTAPTAAVNTNTTQIATTAFVLGQVGTATPLMAGTAAVGTATRFAREDHRHPTDTSRAPVASPTFTGTVTAPTFSAEAIEIKASTGTKKFTLDYNETEDSLDFIFTL